MMRRLLLGMLAALLLAVSAAAQTFPATIKIGFDPAPAADSVVGYRYTLDGGAPVDLGLPATNPSCVALVGGAVAPCVFFSVAVPTSGSHTVQVFAYSLLGDSAPATFTFALPNAKPSTPGTVRIIK
jgi:hypothetical protein